MKKGNPTQISNLTAEIIDLFLGIPESFIYSFDREEFYRMMHGFSKEKVYTYSKIAKILHSLKRSGYVRIEKQDKDNQKIIFTNKAHLAIIDRQVARNPQDGIFRFVSFDIPEEKRRNRDQFRRSIKRMGFIQIQKSLWVTNKNVGNYVEIAANEYQVSEYIVYLVTVGTNIDWFLKDLFDDQKES